MIKTWDIFDTLIARRCVFPQAVFHIVERTSNSTGFVQARIAAESNVSGRGNYNLDDIYEEFRLLTNAPKNICDTLKKLECDVEIEQSIPITENIRQVKSGDILISDMYLPETVIRRMLTKAGLLVPVEILITSGGKSSGRIWKDFAEQKKFLFHVGDNFESDVKNSRFAGFESALTALSKPQPIEQYLLQKDFNFGAYLREIRLRNPFSEEIKRIYWQLFTLNIGILILLVQQIDNLQKKCGFEYLGFCGRDTHYLRLLYEKYKLERGETPTPNDYLYYSRKLVRNSGEELAKYFSAKINNRKALMIDLTGTGTHLHNLREKFGLSFSILICLIGGQKWAKEHYPTMLGITNWTSAFANNSDIPANKANIFLIEPERKIPGSDAIEMLNRATHNSPIRLNLIQIGEKLFPEVFFNEVSDTENFDVMESCFREVLNSRLVTSTYVFGNGGGVKFEELLLPLLNIINSSFIQVPLKGGHGIIASSDNFFLQFFETVSSTIK